MVFNKMKRSSLSTLPILLLFILSCKGSEESAKGNGSEKGTDEGTYVNATVEDYTHLDGCQYMLILEDEKKLYPLNLEKAYREDGLKVRVKYEKKDAMTTCMSGTNVQVLDIEKREE